MNQTASLVPRQGQRKWRRRLLLTLLFLVASCIAGILFFLGFSSYELNALMAEMDRLDPGWRLYEIEAARKVVPDVQNSALHILAIKNLHEGKSISTAATERQLTSSGPVQ